MANTAELHGKLVSNCGNWPKEAWTPSHTVARGLFAEGARAVDFTLRDVDGTPHTLSDLLGTRPVLLMLGAYT
ncbi:MAG: hypothetical protein ACR2OD_03330 [Gaiellaceae bacterium]